MNSKWPGFFDLGVMNESLVDAPYTLADAAKKGCLEAVIYILEANEMLDANQCRFGGTSWFTPLHHAAWLGAPVEVVAQLLRLGTRRAPRTSEPTASSSTRG